MQRSRVLDVGVSLFLGNPQQPLVAFLLVSLENQPKRGTNFLKKMHEPIYAWNPSKALVRVLQALRELDLRYLGLQKYQEGFGDAGQLRVGWERGNYTSLPGLKREPMMKISSLLPELVLPVYEL